MPLSEEARRKLLTKAAVQRSERPLAEEPAYHVPIVRHTLSSRPKLPRMALPEILKDFRVGRVAMSCCAALLILCMVLLPVGMQFTSGKELDPPDPIEFDISSLWQRGSDSGDDAASGSEIDLSQVTNVIPADPEDVGIDDGHDDGFPAAGSITENLNTLPAEELESGSGLAEDSAAGGDGRSGWTYVPDGAIEIDPVAPEGDTGYIPVYRQPGQDVQQGSGTQAVQDQQGTQDAQDSQSGQQDGTSGEAQDGLGAEPVLPVEDDPVVTPQPGVVVIPEGQPVVNGETASDEAESYEESESESEPEPELPPESSPPDLPVESDPPSWLFGEGS